MTSAFSRFARRAGLVTFRQIFVRLGHVRQLPLLPQGSKAMMKWKEQLNGDCPRRDARSLHERCDLICPELPKIL
jgi:hypothetical protein